MKCRIYPAEYLKMLLAIIYRNIQYLILFKYLLTRIWENASKYCNYVYNAENILQNYYIGLRSLLLKNALSCPMIQFLEEDSFMRYLYPLWLL